jgi:hypothetical protein
MSDRSPGSPDTGPGEDPQDRTDERERYSCAEACETVEGGRAPDAIIAFPRGDVGDLRTDHAMS